MDIQFDFPNILDLVTGLDGWKKVNESTGDAGTDYSFKTEDAEHEANINVDQECLTIEVDGQCMYSGSYEEDESLRPFITGDLPELTNEDEES